MSQKAFVTGASGFVGSHVVHELHAQGWEVHVLARRTSNLEELAGVPFELHFGDVTDADSVFKAMPKQVDAVFHVAASTNFWSRKNEEQIRINVTGTHNMVEAAIDADAGRFIHTSSFVTWGFPGVEVNENSPRDSSSDWINYVKTKHESEFEVLQAAADGWLDAVVLNPANVLGPGDWRNWSRVFRMVDQQKVPGAPPGGGNFCDVREVAKAHVRAFHDGGKGEKYLLGGEFARIVDVLAIAGEMMNKPVPTRPMPAWLLQASARLMTALSLFTGKEPDLTPEAAVMASRDIICNSGKAERELGYRSVPLRTMIRDTIDWMKDRGMLQ